MSKNWSTERPSTNICWMSRRVRDCVVAVRVGCTTLLEQASTFRCFAGAFQHRSGSTWRLGLAGNVPVTPSHPVDPSSERRSELQLLCPFTQRAKSHNSGSFYPITMAGRKGIGALVWSQEIEREKKNHCPSPESDCSAQVFHINRKTHNVPTSATGADTVNFRRRATIFFFLVSFLDRESPSVPLALARQMLIDECVVRECGANQN